MVWWNMASGRQRTCPWVEPRSKSSGSRDLALWESVLCIDQREDWWYRDIDRPFLGEGRFFLKGEIPYAGRPTNPWNSQGRLRTSQVSFLNVQNANPNPIQSERIEKTKCSEKIDRRLNQTEPEQTITKKNYIEKMWRQLRKTDTTKENTHYEQLT